MRIITFSQFFITTVSLIIFAGCSSNLELKSQWRNQDITIDGIEKEWDGTKVYLKKENIVIGTMNDENYLYLCLVPTNQIVKDQIMRQGFTVWFDADGGNDKYFGIRFPLGVQEAMEMLPKSRQNRERDPEKFREMFERTLDKLEIIGPAKDDLRRLSTEKLPGIDIKIAENYNDGMLAYELKIPLIRDEQNPYGIGTELGEFIGIGLEIAKIDRKDMKNKMAGMQIGMGGGGGRGGKGGGRRGGRDQMGVKEMGKPLDVWTKVKISIEN